MTERPSRLRRSRVMALAALLPLLFAAPASAARGDNGGGDGDEDSAEVVACPTDLWTVPLEIPSVACVLLIPKGEEGESSGLLG
jgi:hypothetical protein